MVKIPSRTWKYIALILTQFLISLFGLGSNGIHSIVCHLPGHNTTIYLGLWEICYLNHTDSFLSCDFVFESDCSGFCNLFYTARVLVLLNSFVSLCLIGLFLNKIGVKRWVTGAGSFHCFFFAILQIVLTFTTSVFLCYLYLHVKKVNAGLDEWALASGFDVSVGWCFLLPVASFVLSMFVIYVPAKEIYSKVQSAVTPPVLSSNEGDKNDEVPTDDSIHSKLQRSAAHNGDCSPAQKLLQPEKEEPDKPRDEASQFVSLNAEAAA